MATAAQPLIIGGVDRGGRRGFQIRHHDSQQTYETETAQSQVGAHVYRIVGRQESGQESRENITQPRPLVGLHKTCRRTVSE